MKSIEEEKKSIEMAEIRRTKIDETNKGRRVELIHTNDPYTRLKPGSQGTYQFMISNSKMTPQHLIDWDDGSNLSLLESIDSFKFIEERMVELVP